MFWFGQFQTAKLTLKAENSIVVFKAAGMQLIDDNDNHTYLAPYMQHDMDKTNQTKSW